ncbi:MAG: DUF4321 domain-containing protein, partial [Myxococcales bacterium]|nr:DUF4321 domain-containing protein [Myxococcales bacterium]
LTATQLRPPLHHNLRVRQGGEGEGGEQGGCSASLGPLSIDLHVLALTLGPLILRLNILSVIGILLIAWFARSLL